MTTEVKEDDFDAAFEAAAVAAEAAASSTETSTPVTVAPAETPAPVVAAPAETPAPVVAAPAETPAAAVAVPAETPAAATVSPAVTTSPAESPVATPPIAPAPQPAAPVLSAETPPAETPEQKHAREAFEASIKPYEFSDEEKNALEQFKKDFPNEALAVEARMKAIDREINARVYAAAQGLLQQVYSDFGPIAEGVTIDAQERHFAALHAAVPDYDAVITKIPSWIDTQPEYLRAPMRQVYEGGTTQDVLALVKSYKAATSISTPTPGAPTPAPTASALPPADAADLTPTPGKRTTAAPRGAPDKNDFDGAWAELEGATR
ncbi:MAG: hypothetical protein ACYDBH_00550 [Acidobacteriaceae bacterium]